MTLHKGSILGFNNIFVGFDLEGGEMREEKRERGRKKLKKEP